MPRRAADMSTRVRTLRSTAAHAPLPRFPMVHSISRRQSHGPVDYSMLCGNAPAGDYAATAEERAGPSLVSMSRIIRSIQPRSTPSKQTAADEPASKR